MAFFFRRRLQAMLDDLSRLIPEDKSSDLLGRLENKRVDQALPAEIELALLWSFSKLGEMDVEPEWWGDSRRPDIVTEHLVPGTLTAVEIAAATDNSISGKEAMHRIAIQFVDHANATEKGVGKYLYFIFGDTRIREKGKFIRIRLAPEGHVVSAESKDLLRQWIKSGRSKSSSLNIVEEGLHVTVERKAYRQPEQHNTFSSVPPEANFIDDNPLYDLLKRKTVQLKAAKFGTLRVILIGDVGSSLLRQIGSYGERHGLGGAVSGSSIISEFVKQNPEKIDAVVVVSPYRKGNPFRQSELSWRVDTFSNNSCLKEKLNEVLSKVIAFLPKPRFEGSQARSLFLQDAFSPGKMGWYSGVHMESQMEKTTLHIPARALLDLLAGRITPEQFSHFMGDGPGSVGLVKSLLDDGNTLSNIEMAPRDIDVDDDHIVLHFTDDAAARALRVNRVEPDCASDEV
ncbi:hypothetical protein [Agrobacterium tumefaciens]|uniref:hypothetical protein n=1 Tax=Agrobacterium tumefaciens TaxID=358 RepID=UPI000470D9C8